MAIGFQGPGFLGASFLVPSKVGEGPPARMPSGRGGEGAEKSGPGVKRQHQRMLFMRMPGNQPELIWTLELTTCTSVACGGDELLFTT